MSRTWGRHAQEIDFVRRHRAGANYGWRCYEGTTYTTSTTHYLTCSNPSCPFVFPATEYIHAGGRCSITGGYVYAARIPALQELLLRRLLRARSTQEVSGDHTGITERTADLVPAGGLYTIGLITSFGEDARGELYICDADGEVYRIVTEDSIVGVGGGGAPARVQLRVVGPLPFRTDLALEVDLPGPAEANVEVFDVKGRRVRTLHKGILPAGRNPLGWDGRLDGGSPAPSGSTGSDSRPRGRSRARGRSQLLNAVGPMLSPG